MNIYWILCIGGLIGIALHVLKTLNSINKRNDKATLKLVIDEYWAHDKLALFTSIFCYMVLLFISSEFVNLNQLETIDYSQSLRERLYNFRIANFIKVASVIAGYFSDSLVFGFMSVTEKRIKTELKAQEEKVQ